MIDWRIRLARSGDGAAMSEIEASAAHLFEQYEEFDDLVIGAARTPQQFESIIRKGRSLVAELDGRIIGLAAAVPFSRELHLEELSVGCDWQGQGAGALLLSALCIDARASGFQAVTLETFCEVPWNRPFYGRRGFEVVEDLAAHPRLKEDLDRKISAGMPAHVRCAMIKFLA
ncbi:GNAT family N-acetyltransferase [Qipengyuania sp. RANM35]|uniref:GNAT family N-acetyltransferase n=1 Tax=Qipengyuania sp. RANM35 TaxID=3068635 RepID=UPI0034DB741B